MDINRDTLENLFTLYESKFTDAYNNANDSGMLERLAMVLPSTTSSHSHNWLEQLGVMREWVGDRQVQNVASNSFTVKNKRWERTIGIERVDIEDDNIGHYDVLFTSAGREAVNFKVREVVTEMVANNNWGGDDAAFFGTTRTYGSNTIDNYTTSALTATTFETAYQNMQSYLGQKDEPLEVNPKCLVVGPKLRKTAFEILESQNVPNSSAAVDNPNMGLVQTVISSRLTGANDDKWFLLGETSGIMAFAWQERVAPEVQDARTDPNGDFVFQNDQFQFGIRARGVAVPALPHLAYFGDVA